MHASSLSLRSSGNRGLLARPAARRVVQCQAIKITEGVEFDTIAREWRMKWSPDNEKASLQAVQQELNKVAPQLKAIPGVKNVQRVVCGGCLDYKVVVSLDAGKFGEWEAKNFAPEDEFLAKVKAIPGVSVVETQTYTLTPV